MLAYQLGRPQRRHWMMFSAALLLVLGAVSYVLAYREDPNDRPYLSILGGGFVVNYRVAETYYGFTAKVVRPVPVGTVLEASFDDPAGDGQIIVTERLGTAARQYAIRTPAVFGVKKDTPYTVVIRLLERGTDKVIWQTERQYSSVIDQDVVPNAPLSIGPGYARPVPATQ